MLSGIKATLFEYHELSWNTLTALKQWMRSKSFKCFNAGDFSAPSLHVAVATNSTGETLCIAPIERVLVIGAWFFNPSVTPHDALKIGDVLDAEVAHAAQQQGISKLMILVGPHQPALPDCEEVRAFIGRIPLSVKTQGLGCHTQSHTEYLN